MAYSMRERYPLEDLWGEEWRNLTYPLEAMLRIDSVGGEQRWKKGDKIDAFANDGYLATWWH